MYVKLKIYGIYIFFVVVDLISKIWLGCVIFFDRNCFVGNFRMFNLDIENFILNFSFKCVINVLGIYWCKVKRNIVIVNYKENLYLCYFFV